MVRTVRMYVRSYSGYLFELFCGDNCRRQSKVCNSIFDSIFLSFLSLSVQSLNSMCCYAFPFFQYYSETMKYTHTLHRGRVRCVNISVVENLDILCGQCA